MKDKINLNPNIPPCFINIISNNNNLIIHVQLDEANQNYSTCLCQSDLNNISTSFNAFSSLTEIQTTLNTFINTYQNDINFTNNETNLIIKFTNLFPGETITFTLLKSTVITNSINTTSKLNPYRIPNTSNSKLHIIFNSNFFYIIYFILSILLLLCLLNTIYKLSFFPHNYTSSKIATKNDINMISTWINPDMVFNYTLLYRASRDGDTANKFHELCDFKGPTVTLISTTEGWRFGGYTDALWESFEDIGEWKYKMSLNAFIFSLNKRKMYPIQDIYKAILCQNTKGPTFGYGSDFAVSNNSFVKESTCYAPTSYINMTSKNEFNGGKAHFIAKEIEVFLIDANQKK